MKIFKNQRQLFLVTSAMWIFYGIISIYRYEKVGDDFLYWSGLFILITHGLIFIAFLFKKDKLGS